MRRIFWALAVVALLGNAAAADENDLSGGVMITHAPPGYTYTSSLDACGDWETIHDVTECGDVVARIDTESEISSVWYVVAAWDEAKAWQGFEFGLGDYDGVSSYYFVASGSCVPDGVIVDKIWHDQGNWPGPNNGVAVVARADGWAGNYQALYWFAGYAYGEDLLPLAANPATENAAMIPMPGHGGQVVFPPSSLGALGIYTDGVVPCPVSDTGACCAFGGVCTVATEAECTTSGGTFEGVGTVCDPNPCDIVWACCVDEVCMMLSEADCTVLEGTWHADRVCVEDGGDYVCPPDDADDPSWGWIKASYR
ncbi:MAG: hypothetical protein KAY32_01475 [Candidatus Eisenbacteria sp.]|nr:hypothetical protein [Candidatus Eisenbacteria bacterium]